MRLNLFLNKQCHNPLLPGGGLFINHLVVDRSYETVRRGRRTLHITWPQFGCLWGAKPMKLFIWLILSFIWWSPGRYRRDLMCLWIELVVCFSRRDISSLKKFYEARRTQRNPRKQLAVEGAIAGSMLCLLWACSKRDKARCSVECGRTELNNETSTLLACGKERGLKRARLKNALIPGKNMAGYLKPKHFFVIHDIPPFWTFRGTKLILEGIRLV